MDLAAPPVAQAQPAGGVTENGVDPAVAARSEAATGTSTAIDGQGVQAAMLATDGQAQSGDQLTPTGTNQDSQPPTTSLNPQLDEFNREFRKAQDSPANFQQWMAVEKLVDKLGDMEKTRQVYDSLLTEFPLCYGFWRKYADAEHKYSSPEWATNVYDRGIAAVPYSADFWGYYCNYKQKLGATPDEVRQLFEQGIAYVGTDYLAHVLWDKYIKYETTQGAFANVGRLYVRILGCPLKELDRYLAGLKTFVGERPALDLMTAEEYGSIEKSLQQGKATAQTEAAAQPISKAPQPSENGDPSMEIDDEHPTENTEAPLGSSQPAEGLQQAVSASDITVSEEEVKAHWLSGVEALYEETKKELGLRKPFEDAIKRPYFHVKPLDQNQLAAWNSYIDYVLQKDDAGIIVRLFERCLVACASYPEFWVRYVRYLEKGDASNALGAVQRAEHVHCKRNATFQLFAAKYYERTGDITAARGAYHRVLTDLASGLVEATVQAAHFERRQGAVSAARKLFDDALAAEEAKEGNSNTGGITAVFYAEFLVVHCKDASAARQIYDRALRRWKGLLYLWEGAIHLEEHLLEADREERTAKLYRQALSEDKITDATLSEEDKEALSSQYTTFADANLNPAEAEKISAAHADRFSKYAKISRSKKRAAEVPAGEESVAKKSAVETGAGQAVQPAAALPATFDQAALAAGSAAPTADTAASTAASGAIPSYPEASQPALSAATAAVAQAAYYPTASAAAYNYGYYQYPQQYGYSYPGY